MPTTKPVRAIEFVKTQTWAILPENLQLIEAIAERNNGDPEAVAAKLDRPLNNTQTMTVRDKVAVLPVSGPIFRYANLFSRISGAASIEILATDFNQALEDPSVDAIVLEIDSPGGMVAGVAEFANMVYSARDVKPITAYISDMGASAAYWIASAAGEIVVSDTARVGSIGVVQSYVTDKQANVVEVVSSQSPNKRPDITTESGRAQVQTQIDALGQVFVEAVAKNRGISPETVLADFGQGGLFVGAGAVKAGLADKVGSLESVIAGQSGAKSRVTKGAPTMANEATEKPVTAIEAPPITVALITEKYPSIAEAFRAEGFAKGAEAERARIQAVEEQVIPGHEKLIAGLKYDGKTTGPEAAVKVLAAEKTLRADKLDAHYKAAPEPLPAITIPEKAAEADSSLPIEEQCKAIWDSKPEIRQEFASVGAFTAFKKAEASGAVRILKK